MAIERTSISVSVPAAVLLALLAGGCDGSFESNQAACERMFHSMTCGAPSIGVPPEIDFVASYVCATVPETAECGDWPELADCVTTFFCEAFATLDPEALESEAMLACEELAAAMEENGCLPERF